MTEEKFVITTTKVKTMDEVVYRVADSEGKGITVHCETQYSWSGNNVTGYEYFIRGHHRRWKYPHYAIVWAIKYLTKRNRGVASAEVSYKRIDQIQILRTALFREQVIKVQTEGHSYWISRDERGEDDVRVVRN